MTVAVTLKPKSLKLLETTRKKNLRARLTGDAVESRAIILKLFTPRPHRR